MPGVSETIDGVSPVTDTWGNSTFGGGRKTSHPIGQRALTDDSAGRPNGLTSGFGEFSLGAAGDDGLASDATNWATTFGAASQLGGFTGLAGRGAVALAGQGLSASPPLGAPAQTPAPTSVTVAPGATVDIAGPGTDSVTFAGATGTLVVEDPRNFEGQVSGLAGADTIDLADLSFNSSTEATFLGTASGGTLTVSNGTETAKIALAGDYLSSTWTVSSDGSRRHRRRGPGRQHELASDEGRRRRLRRRPRHRARRHDGGAHRHQRRLSLERNVLAAAGHLEQHARRFRRRRTRSVQARASTKSRSRRAIRASCT